MPIKVVELFAGVGGFRLALEGYDGKSPLSNYTKKKKTDFEVVWSNQWEPSTKRQHASEVYEKRFGKENHSNEDIEKVILNNFEAIPDHDLLVGGFPCQDYSVANTLKRSGGLKGKKGVLWWSIYEILDRKKDNRPGYLILENVDRLLKSPSKQRGRDFAVMLSSLHNLGYAVEWRVINAADYGFPQKRRRVFIVGYHKSTRQYELLSQLKDKINWISNDGLFAEAFPVIAQKEKFNSMPLLDGGSKKIDLTEVTENFNKNTKQSPFEKSGVMIDGKFWSIDIEPVYDDERTTLKDIIVDEKEVPESFYVKDEDLERWEYLKGAKKEKRVNKTTGHVYHYSEGNMNFPDELEKPARTIITAEGGKSPSRSKHVIKVNGRLRRLTPVELERLNQFPDDFTKADNITKPKRAFFMGNALVVGVVERIGDELQKRINPNR